MSSRQSQKEERAEAAAREAADELNEVNRERREQKGGEIIGGVLKSVQETLGHAKDVVAGKTQDTAEIVDDNATKETKYSSADKARGVQILSKNNFILLRYKRMGLLLERIWTQSREVEENVGGYKDYVTEKTKETKDATAGKMGEYKDYAAEKTKELKDSTVNKAGEYKDYTAEKTKEMKDSVAEKAGEYKDSAAEKAKETKDATMEKGREYVDYSAEKAKETKDIGAGKLSELKESAADAAKRAMDYLTGKKEEMRHEEPKEKYELTEDEARKRIQELKLEEEGVWDEDKQRAKADKETAADRGIAAKQNIYGAIGIQTVKDAIKDKLTMPRDIRDERHAARVYGVSKRVQEENQTNEVNKPTAGDDIGRVTSEDFTGVRGTDKEGAEGAVIQYGGK